MIMRVLTIIALFFSIPVLASQTDSEDHVYVKPTMKNISKMYWRLNKFAPDDPGAVDRFMQINECEIFTNYIHDEFEWREIRDVARQTIEKGIGKYPLRFEFVQPFVLGEYDFEREGFHVAEQHRVEPSRRFEVISDDLYSAICGERRPIPGYPKALLLEFSRPFAFMFVPVEADKAQTVLDTMMAGFDELDPRYRNQHRINERRTAFMVLKAKFFAYKPRDERTQHGYLRARVLTIVEGFEVYADKARTVLLFDKNFRRTRNISAFEKRLKEEYETRKAKLRAELMELRNSKSL